MVDFTEFYTEIEKILSPEYAELSGIFNHQVLTKKPKDVYLWCSENLKTIDNHRLQEILADFYYSVR